ncbi:MAG: hypothetical protein NT027_15920 [Proteobacteria bacterium]|nr:hypothetical protein [Pseudomonadota bacterium]
MFNRRQVVKFSLAMLAIHSTSSCKKNSSGSTKAITSEDGQKSFALIPIRMKLSTAWESQLAKNPMSLSLAQGLRFGVYECTGANAEPEAMLLEAAYESSGEALRREGREIKNHLSTVATPSTCKLEGTFLAGPKVIAKMITDTPHAATQAVYLALRGPTTLNHQTPGARFYDALTELFAVEFGNINRFVEASKGLDTLYNPCVEDEGSFAKNKKFECKNSGSYKVKGSYDDLKKDVLNYIESAETQYIASLKSSQPYATGLYQASVDLKWNDESTFKIDDAQFKSGSGNVFSPDRTALASALGVDLADLPNAPMTVSSAWDMETPDSKNPRWRKLVEGRYTKDDISFFSKDSASGKWLRTVVTSAYEYLKPIGERKGVRVFSFEANDVGLALGATVSTNTSISQIGLPTPKHPTSTLPPKAPSNASSSGSQSASTSPSAKSTPKPARSQASESTPKKPVDPEVGMTKPNPNGREQWIAEQGPKMKAAVEDFRSGKISGEQFRDKMTEMAKQMPYGDHSYQGKVESYQSADYQNYIAELKARVQRGEITAEKAVEMDVQKQNKWRQDPWTDKHNCVDISAAVCRSMYPLMPSDTVVGQISVQAKENKGGKDKFHSINYFKTGSKFVAYDQQSGAMSLPFDSLDQAMQDARFKETMKQHYDGAEYEVNYDGNEVDFAKVDKKNDRRGGETYQNSRYSPIRPYKGDNTNFHTIQADSVSFPPPISYGKVPKQIGPILKDGTKGKFDPDKMEWYVPDDNPRKPK